MAAPVRWPGSGEVLRPPRPLRTVREKHASYGSGVPVRLSQDAAGTVSLRCHSESGGGNVAGATPHCTWLLRLHDYATADGGGATVSRWFAALGHTAHNGHPDSSIS